MGKLLTDATGQEIVRAINEIRGVDETGVGLPPSDGDTYAMKNGEWVKILTTSTPNTPGATTEQINHEGETNVTFFLPWKFAMNTTRTALNDVAHTSWRFPFTDGTITKISMKARTPGEAKIDLLIDGSSVLGEPKAVTNAWADYAVDTPIARDQTLELYTTASVTACDLTVSVTMNVGNKTLEFIGESDVQPNVYARGYKAATWGADGQPSPDGQFRSIYMPSVDKLRQLHHGFAAKSADVPGKWYICGNGKYLGNSSIAPATPIEFPQDDVEDVAGGSQSTSSCYLTYLKKDGTVYYYASSAAGPTSGGYATQLPAGLCYSYGWSYAVGSMFKNYTTTNTLPANDTVKKFYTYSYTANKVDTHYLSKKGVLGYFTGTTHTEIPFDKGVIKDFFMLFNIDALFVLTENNELYAQGMSSNGCLGLPPTEGDDGGSKYSDFTKVGVWDVKDIQNLRGVTFMLTHDGKLYHTGLAAPNLVPEQHNAFTQVFPNYRFYDIALSEESGTTQLTLVAIAEYLGEIAE